MFTGEHDRLGFGMLSVETAVFYYICWFSSSRDSLKRSVLFGRILFGIGGRVSKGKIHKSEPEPGNWNVNTVYFVNQARGNTRISRTEFVYDERERDCKCLRIFELPA